MHSRSLVLILVLGVFALGYGIGSVFPYWMFLAQPQVVQQDGTERAAEGEAGTASTESMSTQVPPEGFAISVATLSESQQRIVRTLGIEGDTITITPTMVTCAETRIGAARVTAIAEGATPSLSEGAALIACYSQ